MHTLSKVRTFDSACLITRLCADFNRVGGMASDTDIAIERHVNLVEAIEEHHDYDGALATARRLVDNFNY